MRNLIVSAALLLCAGCTLNGQFVAAEYATYEAIGPRYVKYVEADQSLDDDTKALRTRTVSEWKATLDEARK